MPYKSRSSLITADGSGEDVELPMARAGKASAEKISGSATLTSHPLSGTTLQEPTLPAPATASVSSGRRGKHKKSARVNGGLRVHWAQFKRRIGNGTAPSTSNSAIEGDESGDSYSNGYLRRQEAQGETEDEGVDEVVVDREWSDEIKSSSITHSEHGGSPEKSSNHLGGTNTDRESLSLHAVGFWASCGLLVFLRWRVYPIIRDFFVNHFIDEKSEMHYNKENWFLRKNLAFWSAAFFIVNWALATAFIQQPIVLSDKIFYYAVSPTLVFPVLLFVMYDFPRDRDHFYQIWLVVATWQWAFYQIIFMRACDYYRTTHHHCGSKDFLSLFYYTSAMQTVAIFGLKLNRFPAMLAAVVFFVVSCALIIPMHTAFVRNMINFLSFQAFLLYIHYMRENAERRLYTLRDQLKIQFRATQKAQVNERKAADSKRRLTSYVFHEVRVPLNTALLAVQNMEAYGSVAKAQEIEFKALEGSLSMMSKVLNDVLDFNRMDSGRFESVLKPYSFHQVMRSMFVPLQLATDARGLDFVTDLDKNIDDVARRALYEALGESKAVIDKHFKDLPDEDGIVVGDETRLRQIITNLASNACKFTPTGGKLTITTRLVLPLLPQRASNGDSRDIPSGADNDTTPRSSESGPLKYPPESDGRDGLSPPLPHRLSATHLTQHNTIHSAPPPVEWIVVRIEVTDTGYGIRPKDMVQSKLFSAFNQTEQGRLQGGKGTGLGLALVRQIVKLSGGRLGVKSKVDVGSTFWVELPLGIGSKATPALMMPPEAREDALGTPSSMTKTARSATYHVDFVPESPELRTPSHMQPSQSSSALHSIMEQGGLVEISTQRGERQSVLTRTIGDPSTGTGAIGDDITPPSLSEPPPLEKDDSSATVRPRLDQLPKPQAFTVDGPLSPATSSVTSSSQTGTAASTSGGESPLRVLVVDDDPLTRKLMSRMLTRIGCRVMTAENGEIALEMILGSGQHATPSSEDTGSAGLSADASPGGDEYRYQVIFLDNQMPVLSGLEAVSKLREMGRRDFVVGVTGNALLSDQQEYVEAGADHVLTKPVLEKSLKSMLAIAEDRRKRGGPASTPEPSQPAPS
ncbi:hybrid sensor histidine kinase [Wolfiporia cocos MD-104 SS10]|uniref:histidine kinase n=1 Tax=Wolfiporia cocos (strain MD-104) TaxID=742152 RepID=A0A2H3J2C1_WOLCO|nr:hybrid sensor histidine kinase [Wolfiporia cocos MD-104 SS10]